jgi:hypothetical protein
MYETKFDMFWGQIMYEMFSRPDVVDVVLPEFQSIYRNGQSIKEPISVTRRRWSSDSSQRKRDGDGRTIAGNTNRIGGTWVESETSSTINPPWMRRKRTVPVVGVLSTKL